MFDFLYIFWYFCFNYCIASIFEFGCFVFLIEAVLFFVFFCVCVSFVCLSHYRDEYDVFFFCTKRREWDVPWSCARHVVMLMPRCCTRGNEAVRVAPLSSWITAYIFCTVVPHPVIGWQCIKNLEISVTYHLLHNIIYKPELERQFVFIKIKIHWQLESVSFLIYRESLFWGSASPWYECIVFFIIF